MFGGLLGIVYFCKDNFNYNHYDNIQVNVPYSYINYRFLSFWDDFMIQSRISDKSNSKNRILMFNFAFKNKH